MRLINRHPDRPSRLLLVLLPFVLVLFAYFMGSAERLAENPDDKLLPSAVQMTDAVQRLAFIDDKPHRRIPALGGHGVEPAAPGHRPGHQRPGSRCAWASPPAPCRCSARRCRPC